MTAEHGSVVDHHIVNCGKVLKSSHHLGQISLSLSCLPLFPLAPLYISTKSLTFILTFSPFFSSSSEECHTL